VVSTDTEAVTSPVVDEMLVLLLAGVLATFALHFANQMRLWIGVVLLILAVVASLLTALRHKGLL